MLSVAIYTPGRRETKGSKVPCLRKQRDGRGLNPRSPDPELEVLTTQPLMPPLNLLRKLLIIVIIIIVVFVVVIIIVIIVININIIIIIIIIIVILIFQRKF